MPEILVLKKMLLRFTLPPNPKYKSFKNQGSNQFYFISAWRLVQGHTHNRYLKNIDGMSNQILIIK